MLHTLLHPNTAPKSSRRGRNVGTFKAILFQITSNTEQNSSVTLFQSSKG